MKTLKKFTEIVQPSINASTYTSSCVAFTRERKHFFIPLLCFRAFDEFDTFVSCFNRYRTNKAAYYISALNTLWNGPKCYFRQSAESHIKCENPWLSIVIAAHPNAIMNILKEENCQLGIDGLFSRFVFSACILPENVHKRSKREMVKITGDYNTDSCSYPSLTHIMYFIHLMHHEGPLTLKISEAANDILIRTHDEYNNMIIEFQGHQDVLCTLYSKSRDHLYRICGLLHLLHQACIYVLKAEPQLKYIDFDDVAAESIRNMAILAKENIVEYLTISPGIAQTAVELMKFYIDTKKLLYGFSLITIPPAQEMNIRSYISQQIPMVKQKAYDTDFSTLSLSIYPFDDSTIVTSIKKILLYHDRKISVQRLAQILRRPGISAENIKKIFAFMQNCQMGTNLIEKQKKYGKPRISFVKDNIPEDKDSDKYKFMIDFLNQFNITPEEYEENLTTQLKQRWDYFYAENFSRMTIVKEFHPYITMHWHD
ncbi:unnamed protein product [Rotaria sp. Silwood2]|nr:unnamed protein product [Rotaria sp. Silwood2]CAF4144650.1 unnamed protein product [Rotaria sp. Silwood2]